MEKLRSDFRKSAVPYSPECVAIIVAEVARGVRRNVPDSKGSPHRVGNVFFPKFGKNR